MSASKTLPYPLIDIRDEKATCSHVDFSLLPAFSKNDLYLVIEFLNYYKNTDTTFGAYRRELERFMLWSWFIIGKSILFILPNDIENYIQFCLKPPREWVGKKRVSRYISSEGKRLPNPEWCPFVVTKTINKGQKPRTSSYKITANTLHALLAVLGTFYNHLSVNEMIKKNPVSVIRKDKLFLKKFPVRLPKPVHTSQDEWEARLSYAKKLANENPDIHERTLFIVTALYYMQLSISNFAASKRWVPTMNHFYCDDSQRWWFKTLKNNGEVMIPVNDEMLAALCRYRMSLGLSPLPTPTEVTPLIAKIKGEGPIQSSRQIKRLVACCLELKV